VIEARLKVTQPRIDPGVIRVGTPNLLTGIIPFGLFHGQAGSAENAVSVDMTVEG
jgi:hypothetical protein